jgi:16S rRNA (cytidine1402-2'-O)-methyltransferase
MAIGTVYLIPTFLHEDALETIPAYVIDAVKNCTVFFVENEKTARRYLKRLWKDMVIDQYEWFSIHKAEDDVIDKFTIALKAAKNIAIISEAGCPCIADPGQILVNKAQQLGAVIKPFVGPNSILLALMASGMSGQHFKFHGYLPIDATERKAVLKQIEQESSKTACTQIFIETPYRNNQLIKDVLQTCKDNTRFCIAVDITANTETIVTKTVQQWKQQPVDIHKRLAIFLLYA